MGKEVRDHLGNKYDTITEMCEHYGLNIRQYKARLFRNWSLKDALTVPLAQYKKDKTNTAGKTANTRFEVYDYLGNKFHSEQAMCKHYNINYNTYVTRKRKGMNMEQCLMNPVADKHSEYTRERVRDHLGNEFGDLRKLARYYVMDYCTLRNRLKAGLSLDQAIKKDLGRCIIGPHGETYRNIEELAKAYNIRTEVLRERINKGYSMEKALNIDVYAIDIKRGGIV